MSSNLFQNLLVVFILLTLGIIIYCKITNKTLTDFFKEIKELIMPEEVAQ